jgi:hypothetical protein
MFWPSPPRPLNLSFSGDPRFDPATDLERVNSDRPTDRLLWRDHRLTCAWHHHSPLTAFTVPLIHFTTTLFIHRYAFLTKLIVAPLPLWR